MYDTRYKVQKFFIPPKKSFREPGMHAADVAVMAGK